MTIDLTSAQIGMEISINLEALIYQKYFSIDLIRLLDLI